MSQLSPSPPRSRGIPSRALSARAPLNDATHPLLVDDHGEEHGNVLDLMGDTAARVSDARASEFDDDESPGTPFAFFGDWAARLYARRRRREAAPRTVPMRIEPKTFFANERTFLSWLHTAVLIGTIGAGLVSVHLGGSKHTATNHSAGDTPSPDPSVGDAGPPGAGYLTVVHRHEYSVSFPEKGEVGAAPVEALEERAKTAISAYFDAIASNPSISSGGVESRSGFGAVTGTSRATEAETRETGSSAGLIIALTMLTASVLLSLYATYTFIWRGRMIAKRSTVPFHDPVGPVVMGAIMIVALITLIVLTAANFNAGAVN